MQEDIQGLGPGRTLPTVPKAMEAEEVTGTVFKLRLFVGYVRTFIFKEFWFINDAYIYRILILCDNNPLFRHYH